MESQSTTSRFRAGHGANPLAVAIVTYNSADVLAGLLDSLPAGLAGTGRTQIIVVDNDSRDSSVTIGRAHPSRPLVIEAGRNGGYAAGINLAAKAAEADADLLILNPDIRLLPGAAAAMRRHLHKGRAGVVAPNISHEDGRLAHSVRREPSLMTVWSESLLGGRLAARLGLGEMVGDCPLYSSGGPVEWATGAALMISAEARRRVGDWDESFFLYSEEVDYLRRVRQAGFSIVYAPDARAIHIGGEYRSNPFLSALMASNKIRDYARRHGTVSTQLFRLGLIVGEAMRAGWGPGHRAALRAAFFPAMVAAELSKHIGA